MQLRSVRQIVLRIVFRFGLIMMLLCVSYFNVCECGEFSVDCLAGFLGGMGER